MYWESSSSAPFSRSFLLKRSPFKKPSIPVYALYVICQALQVPSLAARLKLSAVRVLVSASFDRQDALILSAIKRGYLFIRSKKLPILAKYVPRLQIDFHIPLKLCAQDIVSYDI
ncbi:unnamed protein product [Pieris macdunnoughi]|uniref:Uncharacterized protein n=1 Tax=Pieris macdunnoughi TaxID=345717 RepID=A0A821UPH3_9NEOP|nr:unnamed protein product [Pieris macdunnoughi]